MVTQALLIWLVIYVSLLALLGFLLYVARGYLGRAWGNATVLRTASLAAFVGATVLWVLLIIVD